MALKSHSALWRSPLIEVVAVLGSIGMGVGSFVGIRRSTIQEARILSRTTSEQLASWLDQQIRETALEEDLREVQRRFEGFRIGQTGFLCIIDGQGRCVVHSKTSKLVGKSSSRRGLRNLRTGDEDSFEEILAGRTSIVGWYLSVGGEEQLVAMTPMKNHLLILGIHIPAEEVFQRFNRIALPVSLFWAVFSLVFLPWLLFGRWRAAQAAERRLASTLDQIPDVVWSTRGNPPEVSYVSPSCEKVTGFTPKELMSTPTLLRSRVDEEDQWRYRHALRALSLGKVVEEEFRYHRKDGEVIWLSIHVSPTLDSNGRLIRTDGVCTDVTRRKRAEMAVQEAESHYRSMVEQTDIVLVRILASGKFVYMSPQVKRIVGYSAEEMMADTSIFDRIVFAEDREKLELLRETRRQLRPETVEVELRYRHTDGGTVWMYEKQVPVTDEFGTIIYYDITAFDVSARKRLEEQLLESQKLETLGNLAAGVAHDFNNILTVISATTELMEESLATGQGVGPNLKALRRATDQAGDMVRGLLTFGPKREMRRRDCDLNEIVEDGMRVIRRVMPASIEIEIDTAERVDPIHADSGQLQHVLLNLCLHAKDVMPDGGRMTVSTGMVTIEERQAAVLPEIRAGLFVVLQVSLKPARSDSSPSGEPVRDSERGKRPDHHPEFRLAMVFRVAREHGGWMDLHTEEGVETVVSAYLPVAGKSDSDGAAPVHSGTEQVLVVDHEQMIAGFIKTVLERRGYQVETADGPERAMDILSRRGEAFSAVIIDSENNDSGQLACLRKLRERRSGLGAILIGGGQPVGDLAVELEHPMTTFLEKPFQAADLAECLRRLLDQKSAGV